MSQDFLNPKSMVTPGVAGALLMFIVNGVCYSFPELQPRYVALAISFLLGSIVFRAIALKLRERVVYWAINSLIIFVMGTGAANLANTTVNDTSNQEAELSGYFIANAYADQQTNANTDAQELDRQREEIEKLRLENERYKKLLEEGNKSNGTSPGSTAETTKPEEPVKQQKSDTRKFFRAW